MTRGEFIQRAVLGWLQTVKAKDDLKPQDIVDRIVKAEEAWEFVKDYRGSNLT